MELRQLRCFVTVAEELHFRRAADRLCMTQPPLSQIIKMLEEELGVLLFERGRRTRVRLTSAGQAFVSAAYRVLHEAEHAKHLAKLVDQGDSGSLSIGYSDDFVYGILPDVLNEMTVRHPRVQVHALQGFSLRLVNSLNLAEVDCILTTQPIQALPANCMFAPWSTSPIVAVVRSNHHLANRGEIYLKELSGERLMIGAHSVRSSFDAQVSKLIINSSFCPSYTMELQSSAMSFEMVRRGYGVALATIESIPDYCGDISVLGLIDDHAALERVTVWREENMNPAVKCFLAITQELVEKRR